MQTDVSDIIRIEREESGRLIDDQARLIRATLEHLSQGVCIFDPAGRLAGSNRRLGLAARPPARRSCGPASRPATLLDRLQRQAPASAPAPRRAEVLAWVRREGAAPAAALRDPARARAVLAVFAEEMPDRGFVMSVTDVTAERDAARALSEANELLEARVASRTLELEGALADGRAGQRLAHALRRRRLARPPAAALGRQALPRLDRGRGGRRRGARARCWARRRTRSQSVQDIIEALLDISRIESGRAVGRRARRWTSARCWRSCATSSRPAAALKGLDLRVRALVAADRRPIPTYIRRILQNLIGNAIRYTETGPGRWSAPGGRAPARRGSASGTPAPASPRASGPTSSRSSTASAAGLARARGWASASPSSSGPAPCWAIRSRSSPRSGAAPPSG